MGPSWSAKGKFREDPPGGPAARTAPPQHRAAAPSPWWRGVPLPARSHLCKSVQLPLVHTDPHEPVGGREAGRR